MRRRILVVGDKSVQPTGFGVYKKQLLETLHLESEHEIAEFAFAGFSHEKKLVPWKYYPTNALPEQPDFNEFVSNKNNKNGEWRWLATLLDWKPDLVISLQDPYQNRYQVYSPLRDFYTYCCAAPVDSHPQKAGYLQVYSQADVVIPYTKYAQRILKESGLTNVWHDIPMGVDPEVFSPLYKQTCKKQLGLPTDSLIFGMVSRNQPRKRIPELMAVFKNYLNCPFVDKEIRDKSYLYLHTTYLDQIPWDLTQSLIDNGLTHRVFFSYMCGQTHRVFASLFKDAVCWSPHSGVVNGNFVSPAFCPSPQSLNIIYNSMDCYVQMSNAEGFCAPIIEVAATDTPIIGIGYAGVDEVINNVGGLRIKPVHLEEDPGSSAKRAIMPTFSFEDALGKFARGEIKQSGLRDRVLDKYTWASSMDSWLSIIDSLPSPTKGWDHPKTEYVPRQMKGKVSPSEFITGLNDSLPWQYGPSVLTEMEAMMHGGKANGEKYSVETMKAKYGEIFYGFNQVERIRCGEEELQRMYWMF